MPSGSFFVSKTCALKETRGTRINVSAKSSHKGEEWYYGHVPVAMATFCPDCVVQPLLKASSMPGQDHPEHAALLLTAAMRTNKECQSVITSRAGLKPSHRSISSLGACGNDHASKLSGARSLVVHCTIMNVNGKSLYAGITRWQLTAMPLG
eukprot:363063-Chlamydomonas_euryale.AAC.5